MIKIAEEKLKIALHYLKPGINRSPSILFDRMEESEFLQQRYDFVHLNQFSTAEGKISIKLILKLRKEIKKIKPDIIHISGIVEGFHCMIASILAGCRNRIIITHGFASMVKNQPILKRTIFTFILEPITLLLATKIQCNSKFSLSQKVIQNCGKNKSSCIYNSSPNYILNKNHNSFRKEHGIDNDETIFISVGNITKDKGFEILAKAIKELNELNKIRFVIIGQGEYQNEMKRMLEQELKDNRVIMTGSISNVLVINIMSESNVFVLPTMLFETFGLVFIEAAMVELPSIGTIIGAVPEVVVPNETGILVPVNDVHALANAMQYMYNEPNIAKSMGKTAFARAKKVFSKEIFDKDIDNLYRSIKHDNYK